MSIENGVFNLLHSSGVLCLSIGGNLRYTTGRVEDPRWEVQP